MTFGSDLLNDKDEELLFNRLVASTNHPSLSPGHRLLCFHWLLHFPENKVTNYLIADCCGLYFMFSKDIDMKSFKFDSSICYFVSLKKSIYGCFSFTDKLNTFKPIVYFYKSKSCLYSVHYVFKGVRQ